MKLRNVYAFAYKQYVVSVLFTLSRKHCAIGYRYNKFYGLTIHLLFLDVVFECKKCKSNTEARNFAKSAKD